MHCVECRHIAIHDETLQFIICIQHVGPSPRKWIRLIQRPTIRGFRRSTLGNTGQNGGQPPRCDGVGPFNGRRGRRMGSSVGFAGGVGKHYLRMARSSAAAGCRGEGERGGTSHEAVIYYFEWCSPFHFCFIFVLHNYYYLSFVIIRYRSSIFFSRPSHRSARVEYPNSRIDKI